MKTNQWLSPVTGARGGGVSSASAPAPLNGGSGDSQHESFVKADAHAVYTGQGGSIMNAANIMMNAGNMDNMNWVMSSASVGGGGSSATGTAGHLQLRGPQHDARSAINAGGYSYSRATNTSTATPTTIGNCPMHVNGTAHSDDFSQRASNSTMVIRVKTGESMEPFIDNLNFERCQQQQHHHPPRYLGRVGAVDANEIARSSSEPLLGGMMQLDGSGGNCSDGVLSNFCEKPVDASADSAGMHFDIIQKLHRGATEKNDADYKINNRPADSEITSSLGPSGTDKGSRRHSEPAFNLLADFFDESATAPGNPSGVGVGYSNKKESKMGSCDKNNMNANYGDIGNNHTISRSDDGWSSPLPLEAELDTSISYASTGRKRSNSAPLVSEMIFDLNNLNPENIFEEAVAGMPLSKSRHPQKRGQSDAAQGLQRKKNVTNNDSTGRSGGGKVKRSRSVDPLEMFRLQSGEGAALPGLTGQSTHSVPMKNTCCRRNDEKAPAADKQQRLESMGIYSREKPKRRRSAPLLSQELFDDLDDQAGEDRGGRQQLEETAPFPLDPKCFKAREPMDGSPHHESQQKGSISLIQMLLGIDDAADNVQEIRTNDNRYGRPESSSQPTQPQVLPKPEQQSNPKKGASTSHQRQTQGNSATNCPNHKSKTAAYQPGPIATAPGMGNSKGPDSRPINPKGNNSAISSEAHLSKIAHQLQSMVSAPASASSLAFNACGASQTYTPQPGNELLIATAMGPMDATGGNYRGNPQMPHEQFSHQMMDSSTAAPKSQLLSLNSGPLASVSVPQHQLPSGNCGSLGATLMLQQQLASGNSALIANISPHQQQPPASQMVPPCQQLGNSLAAPVTTNKLPQATPPPLSIDNTEDLSLVLSAVKETQTNLRTLQPMVMQIGDPVDMEEIASAFKITASSSQFVLASDLPSAYTALNEAWAKIKKIEDRLSGGVPRQQQVQKMSSSNRTFPYASGMMGDMMMQAQVQAAIGGDLVPSSVGAMGNNLGMPNPLVPSIDKSCITISPKEEEAKTFAPMSGARPKANTKKTKQLPPASKAKVKTSKKKAASPPPSPVEEKLENLPPQNKDDPEIIMKRLKGLMDASAVSQKQLQVWDKKNGLPRSHSQTMVNSGRSRKQLQKGVILKKWNGDPLITSAGDHSDQMGISEEQQEQTKNDEPSSTKSSESDGTAPMEMAFDDDTCMDASEM